MSAHGTGRRAVLRDASRAYSLLLIFLTFVAWTSTVKAETAIAVFDVRKTLQMDPSDPVYHDYYINAGPEAGLKKDMFVSIVRRLPIHDPVQNKAQATLSVEVARVRIIHVERNMSVARMVATYGAEDRPLVEFEGIMIGDVLDLTTASMDVPKENRRRKPERNSAAPGAAVEGRNEAKDASPPTRGPTSVEKSFPTAPVPDMVRGADDDKFHTIHSEIYRTENT